MGCRSRLGMGICWGPTCLVLMRYRRWCVGAGHRWRRVWLIQNGFMLPGIGTLAVQSVFNLDVPMIMGTVLFSAFAVVLASLVVDILYRRIDPRVRDAV